LKRWTRKWRHCAINHGPSAPICTIELPASALAIIPSLSGVWRARRDGWMAGGILLHGRTVKVRMAPEARTLDLASILAERISALETAGLDSGGGGCPGWWVSSGARWWLTTAKA
jgi:hypothetical protein